MLAGAVYPSVVATMQMIRSGGFQQPATALRDVFITGGIGSFFGFLLAGIFGSLCLLLMMSIARGLELSEDRTWVAVFAGGLTGLFGTGVSLLHLLDRHVSGKETLFVYLLVAIATLMGQVGAWLGVRRAINAESNWKNYPKKIELPRFSLRVMFWCTTTIVLGFGLLAAFRFPIIEILEIAVSWLVLHTCLMGVVLGLDRWIFGRSKRST